MALPDRGDFTAQNTVLDRMNMALHESPNTGRASAHTLTPSLLEEVARFLRPLLEQYHTNIPSPSKPTDPPAALAMMSTIDVPESCSGGIDGGDPGGGAARLIALTSSIVAFMPALTRTCCRAETVDSEVSAACCACAA